MSDDTSEFRSAESLPNCSRFSNLRGVRWRIKLGVLSSYSFSTEELRRSAADSRRRYASLRRRLLIHPHLSKDGRKSEDLSTDNPLSQNPGSTWGRFFQNVELEKLIDRDLSQLYIEYENYFHSSGCWKMLRRVLLVWCLRHPEYGYRQGMHELLAPLLYVLHIDLQFLSQIRSLYGGSFDSESDDLYFPEGDLPSNYCFTAHSRSDRNGDFQEEGNPMITAPNNFDPETEELFLLTDPYGAEGELGVISSERFMEHDSYNMFDSLMSGANGVVAMAEFFSSPQIRESTTVPPVIEASLSLYHLLSIVDPSLHSHLTELGVEPQYFALRWLRVLFGREFSLDDLLIIWDEIFSSSNDSVVEYEPDCSFKLLCSPRGAFIAAIAVAMLLHMRSSLLTSEYATSCLQRLLNFPKNLSVEKLVQKAKMWQGLALKANAPSSVISYHISKLEIARSCSLPQLNAPTTISQPLPDSYWEEKWRMLHKDFTTQKTSGRKIMKLFGNKLGFLGSRSDPSLPQKKSHFANVKRTVLHDFAKATSKLEFNKEKDLPEENTEQSSSEGRVSHSTGEETFFSDSSSIFSSNTSDSRESDHCNVSESSCVASENSSSDTTKISSSVADNDEEANHVEEISDISVATKIDTTVCAAKEANEVVENKDGKLKQGAVVKERKLFSSVLKWVFRFGRSYGDGISKRGPNDENSCRQKTIANVEPCSCRDGSKHENGDKKVVRTLKNLGQSILENIQVIESVFQQDSNRGQTTAFAALKELRKIGNILFQM